MSSAPRSSLEQADRDFIAHQRMFFVATAPLAADGHVNVSPKGLDTFVVLDERTVAYLDIGGSGIETHAHLGENGRLCLMFCAFDGEPNIKRLHGRGRSLLHGTPEFDALIERFPPTGTPVRGLIVLDVERVSDSCGYGVPLYEFVGQRPTMREKLADQSQDSWREILGKWNAESLDGLPGLSER